MKYLKILYLLSGFILLGLILRETDLNEVMARVSQLGWGSACIVVLIYALSFLVDVISWQLTFQTVPVNARWCRRLFMIRVAGEAYNNVTPMASMGGEPMKAAILKSTYRVGLRESGVSLVLAKTINMVALIIFLMVGFALLLGSEELSASYKTLAGTGLTVLTLSTLIFFLLQRYRVSSIAGTRLSKLRIGKRLEGLLHIIHDLDERLVYFYRTHHWRFIIALLLAIINWGLGVLEIYFVLYVIGHPISWADAWIIESLVQMIRTAAFFIPSGIGAQEATFMLVTGSITGNPALGVSISVIRRSRELLWISMGLLIAWYYGARKAAAAIDEAEPEAPD